MKYLIMPLILAAGLSACATTQLTSGAAYNAARPHIDQSIVMAAGNSADTLDRQIRDIAAIEPQLQFPARIGIARVERGRLTAIPALEARSWATMKDELAEGYGEFVPVSPLIAHMVRPPANDKNQMHDVVSDIRRASARQHIDYVLIYEVSEFDNETSNSLSVADLTILGLYILPSRDFETSVSMQAILLDVRNGYPYGTAHGSAHDSRKIRAAGSGANRRNAAQSVHLEAAGNLAADTKSMLAALSRQLREGAAAHASAQ